MSWVRVGAAVAGLMLGLSGCRTGPSVIPDDLAEGPNTQPGIQHTVAKGQTLWRIARTYGVSPQELAEINNLPDPTKLEVGQALWIPGAERVLEVPTPGTVTVATPKPAARKPPPAVEHKTADVKPVAAKEDAPDADDADEQPKVEVKHSRFIWPVKGPVESPFGVRGSSQHDGIDIKAPPGSAIIAADAGEVIYSGVQRGYGNLVLLKHADGLITIYAHNTENEVKVGAHVGKGDRIASVGQTGRATNPHLHFEVRKDRIPRNPLFFLP